MTRDELYNLEMWAVGAADGDLVSIYAGTLRYLIRAARVVKAMERWPLLDPYKHGDSAWGVLWDNGPMPIQFYNRCGDTWPTMTAAILAAAEWLEKQERAK